MLTGLGLSGLSDDFNECGAPRHAHAPWASEPRQENVGVGSEEVGAGAAAAAAGGVGGPGRGEGGGLRRVGEAATAAGGESASALGLGGAVGSGLLEIPGLQAWGQA